MNKSIGINVSGYINKVFGLGVAVRANIEAMKQVNIPYSINDFNLQFSDNVKETQLKDNFSLENPYPINLVQINIDRLDEVFKNIDHNYFKGKYNIAFWAWELENFPDAAKPYFNFFQEIWVPSNFCAEAISKISPVPVLKFMHPISIAKPSFSRTEFNIPENKFVVLTMFDYYSSIHRKNPLATIDAYEKAFGKNHPEVNLIIKTSKSTDFPLEKQMLINRIADNESISILEEILDDDRLYSLINCCNCFISLHRSEGFGLTMAEAMYFEKPVIATAYSANIEFMNINNSFPVKYSMVNAGNQYYYSTEKDYWADADTDHAAQHLSWIYENPDEAQKIALKGKKDVDLYLSPETIGEKIKDRISYIDETFLKKGENRTSSEITLLEFEKKQLQEKINKLKNYFPIRMKLTFKNLQNKITGKDRKYFWED